MPDCKINTEAQKTKPCFATIPGIKTCSECGEACCPVCGRHKVTVLSRVTGYVSTVSGWNRGKQQELLERQRYNIGVGGTTTRAK